jgi:hypothetical protein
MEDRDKKIGFEADIMGSEIAAALKISYLEGYRDALLMTSQLMDLTKNAMNGTSVQAKIDKLKTNGLSHAD